MADMQTHGMSLSDTSALVLLWAGGTIHTSRGARTYLESLDMDAGRELFEECNKIWGHYGEVIRNRKRCILDMSNKILQDYGIKQMVVLGAGFDALSIDILHRFGDLQIYEVDSANMQLKEELVKRAGIGRGRIHCTDADLKSPTGVVGALGRMGWDSQEASLLVVEGVSYYLSGRELAGLVCLFKNGQSRVILEYLLPRKCISPDRAYIPEGVFGVIKDRYGTSPTRYDTESVRRRLGPGCSITRVVDLKDMELARTGRNKHFGGSRSGWIQVCEIKI